MSADRIEHSVRTRLFLLTTFEEVAATIRQQFRGDVTARHKTNPHDVVTDLDQQVQRDLERRLTHYLPGSAVFAEEDFQNVPISALSGAFSEAVNEDQAVWIVDPIDGTSNFVHGFPFFAISVALWQHGELAAAVVLNPISQEAFSADLTRAYRHSPESAEQVLASSPGREQARAALSTSHPAAEVLNEDATKQLAIFADLVTGFATVRRPICASLELCYVAAGYSDATLAVDSRPWDAAAGALIAQQAGATLHPYWYGPALPQPAFAAPCYIASAKPYPLLQEAAERIALLRAEAEM
ncbi:inositol monophosphatase family protein [Micrococcoides hystricis]|uniref:inositol-phosphate phosphatase n=1 Tax=Micrococcoides hystricis TaxID=1572761 RepID=A0ABV6P9R6_9MICC